MEIIYLISLAHRNPGAAVVVVLGHGGDGDGAGLGRGGVVDVVYRLYLEVVGLVGRAGELAGGDRGAGQPGGPGAGEAGAVADGVVADAGEGVLAGPGHRENQAGAGRDVDSHLRRGDIPGHGKRNRLNIAGPVGGGNAGGGAENAALIEGIDAGPGDRRCAVEGMFRSAGGRIREGQRVEAGQRVAGRGGDGEQAAGLAIKDSCVTDVAVETVLVAAQGGQASCLPLHYRI